MLPGVKAHDIHNGSRAAISNPRIKMLRVIDAADSPALNRFSELRASEVPARNTNVGAQRWVIQRTRNWTSGKCAPGLYRNAASVTNRPALNISEAWSTVISTITRPRIQSNATTRAVPVAGSLTAVAP